VDHKWSKNSVTQKRSPAFGYGALFPSRILSLRIWLRSSAS
jgi:hypothetical protein